jgi:DNA (cytosine-5)-methyltransferase 1
MSALTHLSRFSGIGGLDLAAEWAGFETVGQVEWADYQAAVLSRHWPDVERWRMSREFTAESFIERTGVKPGKLYAHHGRAPASRSALLDAARLLVTSVICWPEYFRVVGELRPRWCVA